MHKNRSIKIVCTGPESSGKSTMVTALANALDINFVPEFARTFLTYNNHPFVREDLIKIGAGQMAWENWCQAKNAGKSLICDTDWTVLQIWEHYKYQDTEQIWKLGYKNPIPADIYLLCSPDFEWVPDPLREHPTERDILFSCYRKLLDDQKLPYIILRGTVEERLNSVKIILNSMFDLEISENIT